MARLDADEVKYLLDANTIILLLSGTNDRLHERVAQCAEGELAMSAIAFAEVALGSWNGKKPSIIVVDRLHKAIPVLPFDHLAAKQYAGLPFRRGSFDRLIAAHALSLNMVLVTDHAKDFSDVAGLCVENWAR